MSATILQTPRSRRLTLPVGLAALAAPILLGLLVPWCAQVFGGWLGLMSLIGFIAAILWWDHEPSPYEPRRPVMPAAEPFVPLSVEEADALYAQAQAHYDNPDDRPAWLKEGDCPNAAWSREIKRIEDRRRDRDIRTRPAYQRAMGGDSGSTGGLGLFLGLLGMVLVGGFLLTILLPLGPFGWVALLVLGLPLIAAIGAAGV